MLSPAHASTSSLNVHVYCCTAAHYFPRAEVIRLHRIAPDQMNDFRPSDRVWCQGQVTVGSASPWHINTGVSAFTDATSGGYCLSGRYPLRATIPASLYWERNASRAIAPPACMPQVEVELSLLLETAADLLQTKMRLCSSFIADRFELLLYSCLELLDVKQAIVRCQRWCFQRLLYLYAKWMLAAPEYELLAAES